MQHRSYGYTHRVPSFKTGYMGTPRYRVCMQRNSCLDFLNEDAEISVSLVVLHRDTWVGIPTYIRGTWVGIPTGQRNSWNYEVTPSHDSALNATLAKSRHFAAPEPRRTLWTSASPVWGTVLGRMDRDRSHCSRSGDTSTSNSIGFTFEGSTIQAPKRGSCNFLN